MAYFSRTPSASTTSTLIATGASNFRLGHTQFLEDQSHRAKIGETILKQVNPHKGGQRQPPRVDKKWAARHTQCQRAHYKKACKNVDVTLNGHGKTPEKIVKNNEHLHRKQWGIRD